MPAPVQLAIGNLIILNATAQALLAKRERALLRSVRIGFNFKCSKHVASYFGGLSLFLRKFVVFVQPWNIVRSMSDRGRHYG